MNINNQYSVKPSGVPWLGDIPAGWKMERLGVLYTHRNEKVSDKDFPPLSVTMKGVVPQLATAAKTDDGDNRKLVRKGDFAINSRSDRRGSCGISAYDGSVSLINTILTPRGQMLPAYFDWLFHTEAFADEFYKWGHGIVDDLWTTRWSEMKRIQIVRPPLPEQRAIAEYLDEKCGAIDAAIAEAKKGIEEYKAWKKSLIFEAVTGKRRVGVFNAEKQSCREAEKMKPSDVPWIGEIPEGWAMIKASKIFSVITDFVASGSFADLRENVKYLDCPDYAQLIRTADVSGKSHELKAVYISKESYDFLSGSNLYGGELLLPNIGASVGDVYIVPKLYERMSLAPNAIMVKNSSCDKFYFYFFSCDSGRLALEDIAESTAQPKFNKTDFRNLRLPAPPTEEQQAIADYLDEKCAVIDAMVAEKEARIADLEAYKKSLIYETVTGKREVA